MKSALLLSIIFITLSSTTNGWAAAPTFYQMTAQMKADYSIEIPFLKADPKISPASLTALANKSAGYEDFLANLNKQSPDLFLAPVLVHSSGSLQTASFEHPRVLLYGGGTLIALSEPATTTKRVVETLSFNASTGTYSSLELSFDGPSVKSETQGETCKACHGESLRPIWLPYDLWPNAYGSFAGFTQNDTETSAFQKFLSQRTSLGGIYKYLGEIQDQSGLISGNDNLTMLVYNMNQAALFKTLQSQKKALAPWRYALIAAFKGCSGPDDNGGSNLSIDSFIPATAKVFLKQPLSKFQTVISTSRKRKTEFLTAKYEARLGTKFEDLVTESRLDSETFPLTDTSYLLENWGFTLKAYQTSNGFFDYAMSLPSNLPMDWSTQAVQLFPEVFKTLKPAVQDIEGVTWAKFKCETLRAESLNSLSGKDVTLPQFKSEAEVSPMGRCISCHVVDQTAPRIPFDDTEALSVWMKIGKNGQTLTDRIQSGSMPLNSTLSPAEKDRLLSALARAQAMEK